MVVFKRALAALIFFLCTTVASHADIVDRVVAIVNDDVITLSEVNEEGKALLQRVAEKAPPSQLSDALAQVRQTIIEKLLEKKIMLQEAEKAQISVTDDEVNLAYETIITRNNTTPELFRQQLVAAGMDETQYKKTLKTQVLSSKLVNLEIRSKVIISEDRVIDYYDTHYTERVGEGGTYLLQIGIAWGNTPPGASERPATKEAAEQKAIQLRNIAVSGEDFRKLARDHSNLPSSVDGGDIGILQKDDMSSQMLNTIGNTKPGDITSIIETSAGYQFFKVLSSQEGQIITKVSYESVKDDIYEILYQEEMEDRYEEWFKRIKSNAYIKIL